MNGAIVFEPFLSTPLLIVAIGLAALATTVYALRSPSAAPLRLLGLAGLIALLANPQIRIAERTPLDDIAILIVDESASNRIDARGDITDATAEAIAARLSGEDGLELRQYRFGDAGASDAFNALQSAVGETAEARLAGVFIVTDGQASDAPALPLGDEGEDDTAPPAPSFVTGAAPVHVLMTGRADEIDRKLTLVNAPRYGIVNDDVEISFRVDDLGPDGTLAPRGGDPVVTLRVDDEEILRQPVPVGATASFNAPLPRPGQTVIELSVDAREGELTLANNVAILPIAAIRDRLRVLLISGEPHAGERAWRNLLKSDPAIDLVHFTILKPMDKARNDVATDRELALIPFPQDELFIEKLTEFDLIIFDRYTYRNVLNPYHFDNIARYVEAGGAVLVSSGPEFFGYLSLAARRNFSFILPALPQDEAVEAAFRPRVSDVGARHPVTADLPEADIWGRWLRIMPATKRSGLTLMEDAAERPLLILDRVGEGRVGMLQSDHVWLWARGFDGGGPHAELLRRIAHWLMKEPELEEERLALQDEDGDLRIERRTIGEDAAPVALTGPDGDTDEIELERDAPGVFTARIADAAPGVYRARSGELFAVGAVGRDPGREMSDVVSDRTRLAPLAAASQGGVFDVRRASAAAAPSIRRVNARGPAAGDAWAGLRRRNASRTDAVRDAPLAPPFAWLALTAFAIVGAWWFEGRRR